MGIERLSGRRLPQSLHFWCTNRLRGGDIDKTRMTVIYLLGEPSVEKNVIVQPNHHGYQSEAAKEIGMKEKQRSESPDEWSEKRRENCSQLAGGSPRPRRFYKHSPPPSPSSHPLLTFLPLFTPS